MSEQRSSSIEKFWTVMGVAQSDREPYTMTTTRVKTSIEVASVKRPMFYSLEDAHRHADKLARNSPEASYVVLESMAVSEVLVIRSTMS